MNNAAQRGLTLIETAFVLAIAAILATSAVAGFGDLRQRLQIKGVAAELASDLQFVRSEAVARNQRLQFSFSTLPVGTSCYVIHTGPNRPAPVPPPARRSAWAPPSRSRRYRRRRVSA